MKGPGVFSDCTSFPLCNLRVSERQVGIVKIALNRLSGDPPFQCDSSLRHFDAHFQSPDSIPVCELERLTVTDARPHEYCGRLAPVSGRALAVVLYLVFWERVCDISALSVWPFPFRSTPILLQTEVAFEYGRPQKTLDDIRLVHRISGRILSLNSNVNIHRTFRENQRKAGSTKYLEDNDLTDVLVRVNQYDPKGEWHRLRAESSCRSWLAIHGRSAKPGSVHVASRTRFWRR